MTLLTSSSSSLEDLAALDGCSNTSDILLADSLLSDIEHFATHCVALRNLLATTSTATAHKNGVTADCRSSAPPSASASSLNDGTAKSLQLHAALALVSQSVRTLLLRYARLFKTASVLVATSQLVQKVKMAISAHFSDESAQSGLHALQRLEDAVAQSLRGAL
ncbi:hypothetical protein niasHT_025851 [Heterodera trifolii]